MQIAQAFPPVAQLQNSSLIPSGDSAVCARPRVTTPVRLRILFPSPPISDAPLHTVARALLGFLLLISVANAKRSSRALARCQSTIPRSHFRSRSGNEAKSIVIPDICFLFGFPPSFYIFFSCALHSFLESIIIGKIIH